MQKFGNSDSGFMPDHVQRMQQRARNVALKRKEEYLGARVPKGLKERVINQAKEQGIPVSLLIRRVLEEVFVEESSTPAKNETKTTMMKVKESEERQKNILFKDVIAWKSIELNKDSICYQCDGVMQSGSEAHIAITSNQDQLLIVCGTCKKSI